MVAVIVVAALAVLALVTQAGVMLVQRNHPAPGNLVGASGGHSARRARARWMSISAGATRLVRRS